ncbi:hypothetical protein J1N35_039629 [Gossypium stocksii]|uniref:Uncharacterized protein n=1 Tax=Gossypium stocksii TaxID=47602 RepID=A0A9D3ZHM4_9ROSI|nr:hypothetical protein J1N35_039629 [Gossypium stocksii]
MKRQHAIIVMTDNQYYRKFKNYCKPHMDGRNCHSDEHYLPTFFNMIDPSGVANRSVTYVDWSEGKWHLRAFRTQDITFEFLKNFTISFDDRIRGGDLIIVYERHDTLKAVKVGENSVFQNSFGVFKAVKAALYLLRE